jgi:hypothetical protein
MRNFDVNTVAGRATLCAGMGIVQRGVHVGVGFPHRRAVCVTNALNDADPAVSVTALACASGGSLGVAVGVPAHLCVCGANCTGTSGHAMVCGRLG